jgi:hypothetical protein
MLVLAADPDGDFPECAGQDKRAEARSADAGADGLVWSLGV